MLNYKTDKLYYSVLLRTFFLIVSFTFFHFTGNAWPKGSANEKSRNLILSENINEAIASYAVLAKNTDDAIAVAEYAYALALGGFYDAALIQLDRIWSIGSNSTDVNYFIGQVFALLGYDDITTMCWKSSEKNKIPAWISVKASVLMEKYKRKVPSQVNKSREELIANFKRANELSSRKSYFQSMAIFQEIIHGYPNEYLPYVCYGITLEKAGAVSQAIQVTEQARPLVADQPENSDKKQIVYERLSILRTKYPPVPEGTLLKLSDNILKTTHWLGYAGGSISHSTKNFNIRIGYCKSLTNYSFDFGVGNNTIKSGASLNIGLSVYERDRMFKKHDNKQLIYCVYGVGLELMSGNGSNTYYTKVSIGISRMGKNRKSSFDVMLDLNEGKGISNITFSFGETLYF